MHEAIEKASVLIEALPYIQRFRDKIIVVKYGGAAMDNSGAELANVLTSIVFMNQVRMWPVLVHGGGPFISEELKRRGIESRFVHGHRYTDERTIEVVEEVLIGRVNVSLVAEINKLGGRAVGLHNRDHHYLHAVRLTMKAPDGSAIDLGLVGQLTEVDAEIIREVCARGAVPVIAPLATGPNGETLNVNADTAATTIAAQLKAEKIVFLTDVPGICTDPKDPGTLRSTLTEAEVEEMVKQGVISGGMLPKVKACIDALDGGVKKAHIIDAGIPHSLLLEIFTDKGIGTQIVK